MYITTTKLFLYFSQLIANKFDHLQILLTCLNQKLILTPFLKYKKNINNFSEQQVDAKLLLRI